MLLLSVPLKTKQVASSGVFCELIEPSDHVSARSKSVVTFFLNGSGPLVVNRRSRVIMLCSHRGVATPSLAFHVKSMVLHFIALLFRVLTTARHSRTVLVNYFSSSHIHIFRRKCEWNAGNNDSQIIQSHKCIFCLNNWLKNYESLVLCSTQSCTYISNHVLNWNV